MLADLRRVATLVCALPVVSQFEIWGHPRRPLFPGLSKIDHAGLPKQVHAGVMAPEAKMLSPEEFASLLAVGGAPVNSSAPVIPAAHSARLIALGYMVDLAGRLRMTTPGRMRIYAGQLAN
jgi:hypothetical protein